MKDDPLFTPMGITSVVDVVVVGTGLGLEFEVPVPTATMDAFLAAREGCELRLSGERFRGGP